MDNNLFREKSIERVSSPEKLDDYIKVVSPGVWFVLAAIIILVLGFLAWANIGDVPVTDAAGTVQMVHPVKFLLN
ncbi:MAG: hypothetical protein K6F86_09285 [Lachnospiraceae bacterium]|nr:hypothetical protein [Lachnospiraceae bacterium]